MKRIYPAALLLCGAAIFARGASLTPEQALGRLSEVKGKPALRAASLRLAQTRLTPQGTPAIYIFNNPAEEGFLVVSADDVALPLLGYADKGSFDEASVSPSFEYWLNEYASQIDHARTNAQESAATLSESLRQSRAGRVPIEPMVRTMWDQGEPFNNQCPKYGTERTYTGCVATAMAQVMNYWKYPEIGQGSVTFNAETIQKKLTMDFSKKAFDWENMADIYLPGEYTPEQADAVSYLMKSTAYAVRSDFGIDSTGALAMYIREGLVRYFNYDGNAVYDLRMMYSAEDWEQMVYDNLLKVGPVLYGGGSMIGGGHSFVCDGYDGDGYFHFNWGWTGISDGYFLLNALNPSDLGSGGGNGGGYNFTQDAVFGIQPPTGEPVAQRPMQLIEQGSLVGEIQDGQLILTLDMTANAMWVNYNAGTMNVRLGARFEPVGGGESIVREFFDHIFTLPSGYGIDPTQRDFKIDLDEAGLEDKSYRTSIVALDEKINGGLWTPVRNPHGYYDYVTVTKNGSDYAVRDFPAPSLDILDGGFSEEIYYGAQVAVWATVRNSSDIELSTGLAPVLVNDNGPAFLGESVLISVLPGETKSIEWTTSLYPMQNFPFGVTEPLELAMTFMDEISLLTYAGDIARMVTMYPNPGTPTLTLTGNPVVENATVIRPGGITSPYDTYYAVSDPGNIPIKADIKLTEGVFAYPVVACLCKMSMEYEGMIEILTTAGRTYFLDEGDEEHFEALLSYPPMQKGIDYLMIMTYVGPYGQEAIPGATRTIHIRLGESGVDVAVSGERVLSYELYDLSGKRLGAGQGAPVTETLPSGVYLLREILTDGSVRRRKMNR